MSDLDEMLKAAGISDGTGESVDPDTFRSGFVTLVGRPNAGKSTLLNHIMGEKLAITSRTPQTTRHRFRAVYDTGDMQMIIVDTPGIHKPKDALGEELNESALQALADVDVIAFLIDASQPVGTGDEWIANHVNELSCGKILVISKADLVKKPVIAERLEQARGLCDFDAEVVVSAKHNRGLDDFIDVVYSLLPTGPRWRRPFRRGAHRRVHSREDPAFDLRRGSPFGRGRRRGHRAHRRPSPHAHLGGHLCRAR